MQAWQETPSMAEKGKGKGEGTVEGEKGKGKNEGEKDKGKNEDPAGSTLLAILDRPNPDPADSTLPPNAPMPPALNKMPRATNKMPKKESPSCVRECVGQHCLVGGRVGAQ